VAGPVWLVNLDRSNTVDHEFIEQYKWSGLFSAVYSCLFLMCATDIFVSYVLCLGLAVRNLALFLCYNISKLTYLLIYSRNHLQLALINREHLPEIVLKIQPFGNSRI